MKEKLLATIIVMKIQNKVYGGIAILLGIFLLFSYYLFSILLPSMKDDSISALPVNMTSFVTPEISKVVDIVATKLKDFDGGGEEVKKSDVLFSWKDNDAQTVNGIGNGVIMYLACAKDYEEYLKRVNIYIPQLEVLLKENGFIKNTENSSISIDDTRFTEYFSSYESDKTVCSLVVSNQCVSEDEVVFTQPIRLVCMAKEQLASLKKSK